MSSSFVPWKYARLMSKSFTSNDTLADIATETSTLLVESTDSSTKDVCATRLRRTRRFSRLALEQSQKHLLNVLHQSLPVPQSNAIALDPLCEFLSMETGYATSLCTNPGSRSTPDLQSQNLPRSFKIGIQSCEVSGTEPTKSPAVFI